MDINFEGEYKSLGPFSVSDLPAFTVLTGPNGSGKSQLLELMQECCRYPQQRQQQFNKVIQGVKTSPNDYLLLTSEWTNLVDSIHVSLGDVQENSKKAWSLFFAYANSSSINPHLTPFFQRVCDALNKPPKQITQSEFFQNFDLSTPLDPSAVFNATISHAFLAFRVKQLEAMDANKPLEEEPPWNLLQEIIKEAGLPFSFEDPSKISIQHPYSFRLTHTVFEKFVNFSELSSGEKVLMSLVFWFFHVKRTGGFSASSSPR